MPGTDGAGYDAISARRIQVHTMMLVALIALLAGLPEADYKRVVFPDFGTNDFAQVPVVQVCYDEDSRRSRSGLLHAAVLCSLFHIFTHILIS
jgi:hypothetical protein